MKKALLLATLALPAIASATEDDEWYLTPQVGAIVPDWHRDLRNKDWLYGLALGKELGPFINLELNGNYARIGDGRGRGHLDSYGYGLDVLWVVNRRGWVAPYVTFGTGAETNRYVSPFFGDAGRTKLMAEAGVGMFIKLWRSDDETRSLMLRPEIKARFDNPGKDGHLIDYLGVVGVQFGFGGRPKELPRQVALAPEPTPPPPPAPPPPPPPPADSDHDGVPDTIDQCPNTPPGVQVDAVGCPIKGSITLEGVNFAYNSAELTPDSRAPLDAMAEGLKKHPRLVIEIRGYTDSVGSDAYNLKLSQQRADSVRRYLVDAGVSKTQLTSRGFGKKDPVASNATAEGRAKNRRVVEFVVENPGEVKVHGEGIANP